MDSNSQSTPDPRSNATYDPGWNDPPKIAYNAQQQTPNRPRNFLNKRVAFPLSNATSMPGSAPPVNLPPMPAVPVLPTILPATPSTPSKEAENVIDLDSDKLLGEVKETLLNILNNSNELGSKANDIKRRISVMEDMWLHGKLNKSIHLQMKELACALQDDCPSIADDIHRALMIDHVGSVGTWMPGIKQLIHHCIARSELLAIDDETTDADNN